MFIKNIFNRALRVLLLSSWIFLLAGAMMGPIYAIFVEKIGGNLLDASFTGGIFSFVAGITAILSGSITDRLKENELMIVLSYILMGIGFFLYIFVHSIKALFLVQIFTGFSEALYYPALDAVYSKHLSKGNQGKQWGMWEAVDYFAIAVGAWVGGVIASYLGFHVLFLVMSFLCFISAFYVFLTPREVL